MADLLVRADHCERCSRTPRGKIHCHRCDTDKQPSAFYRDRKRGPFAYHGGCKACRAKQNAEWYRKNATPKAPSKPRGADSVARTGDVVLTNHRVHRDGSVWLCPRCTATWPYPAPLPRDVAPCEARGWIA